MRILTLALTLLLAAQAQAINTRWLDRSPMQYFTKGDWTLLQQTLDEALVNNANGVSSAWSNPNSGHSGTITPIKAMIIDKLTCREVRFTNETPKASGRSDFTLCQVSDGNWLIYTR